MILLDKIVNAWGSDTFEASLITELENMGVDQLPLQQGLSHSNVALDNNIRAIILNMTEKTRHLSIKVGFFYSGVIAGCSCADDPSPIDEQNEYCEILVEIHKSSGETDINLI